MGEEYAAKQWVRESFLLFRPIEILNFAKIKNKLLHALEERTGLKMKRNHDFAYLSELLLAECHEYISTTTLKRMWGYIHDQESKPSKNTLNVIANFLGFDDFADFCNRGGISVRGDIRLHRRAKCFSAKRACLMDCRLATR